MSEGKVARGKPIPEEKKKLVENITEKVKNSRTILIASIKGLPASQFQKIKKSLRGKAEVVVAKKSIVIRAIGRVEKGVVQNLKKQIEADIALIFSDIEAFELAGILIDNQSSAKAKVGDVAPEDINIEPGPTNLMPGPAISELGAVGLKVKVENGKLAIVQGTTIIKEGKIIDEKVANVMGKLNITPMKAGFIPVSAYDAEREIIYYEISIDKEKALEELRNAISKSLGFAINIGYSAKETVSYFIAKAGMEEKTLVNKIGLGEDSNGKTNGSGSDGEVKEDNFEVMKEEKKEEVKEEKPSEEGEK
jgi:large subunit ribosomal protein L10